MTTAVEPIYFVKHIDGTFSIAAPQPTVNSIFDLPDTYCQCEACVGGSIHASDCAVHNAPALPKGPCDCGEA